jgi:hypothetical protein
MGGQPPYTFSATWSAIRRRPRGGGGGGRALDDGSTSSSRQVCPATLRGEVRLGVVVDVGRQIHQQGHAGDPTRYFWAVNGSFNFEYWIAGATTSDGIQVVVSLAGDTSFDDRATTSQGLFADITFAGGKLGADPPRG